MKQLSILFGCIILVGCQTEREVTSETELVDLPQVLKQACPIKQHIPNNITVKKLILTLSTDRDNLELCSARHKAFVEAVDTRDRIQTGNDDIK